MSFPKLEKKVFVQAVAAVVAVLFVVRLCWPEVAEPRPVSSDVPDTVSDGLADDAVQPMIGEAVGATSAQEVVASGGGRSGSSGGLLAVAGIPQLDFSWRHPIYSVPSYRDCFPDVQDVQLPAALACGVRPVANRADAEQRKSDLLYVGLNPYYCIDENMNRSIPYLVPRASHLLQHIGRRFLDSLAVKGIPLHKMIVTSVLRTEEDVARLRSHNGNATEQSCHRYGTTFDISYNRYHTVAPPDDPDRREVRNDTLKYVLSEVLRDIRREGHCYVKYEVKQGCFHVTVR